MWRFILIKLFQPKDLPYLVQINPEFHFLDMTKFVIKVNLPFGYVAYRYFKGCIRIEQLRVGLLFRKQGIGTELLESIDTDKCIEVIVHEENEYLQWLKKRGFTAIKVLFNHFPDDRDAYLFRRET